MSRDSLNLRREGSIVSYDSALRANSTAPMLGASAEIQGDASVFDAPPVCGKESSKLANVGQKVDPDQVSSVQNVPHQSQLVPLICHFLV